MDPRRRPVVDGGRPGADALRRAERLGPPRRPGRGRRGDRRRRATSGTATSAVRNTNHYGIAGWYALRAAEAGLIGISLSNTSPLVAPTRARQPLIGTNPIAIAAPAGRFGAFCLDMATSTIPRGRIEVAARRGELLPVGWAIDAEGRPATTPEAALAGALHPLGGEEATGGYKGYGLALAVDLLTGVLAGAAFGPNIIGLFSTEARRTSARRSSSSTRPRSTSRARSRRGWRAISSSSWPRRPSRARPGRVLVPGEPEAEAERRSDERGRRDRPRSTRSTLGELGDRFGIPIPGRRSGPDDRPLRRRRRRRRDRRPRDRATGCWSRARTCGWPSSRRRPSSRPTRPATTAASSTRACTTRRARSRRGCAARARPMSRRSPRRTASRSSAAASSSSRSTTASCRGSRPCASGRVANGVPGPRGGRARADPRDRAARRRHPRAVEPGDRHHRLPAGRARHGRRDPRRGAPRSHAWPRVGHRRARRTRSCVRPGREARSGSRRSSSPAPGSTPTGSRAMTGDGDDPRIVPFRGDYYTLDPAAAAVSSAA